MVSLSEVGGLAEDARVVTHNMVGNGHDVGRMFQLIITGSADYVNFATSYGLGQELVEDNGFQQPSTEHTGYVSGPNPSLAKDARVVTHNMVGNGHDVGIESRMDVPSNHHGHSFPTRRRSCDYVNSAKVLIHLKVLASPS
ncbi:hypothetical protein OIU78_001831 [Salix suchowensis]|nr:hypothetical protein OIU78_001831 [Salix suchowensis]